MRRPVLAAMLTLSCRLSGDFEDTAATETGADGSTSSASADSAEPAGCDATPFRIATFNIESVGSDGSDQFDALVATLRRIDADVVCVQEVEEFESQPLGLAAQAAGYDNVVTARRSPAIGGPILNACIGRVPIELIASYSASELSSDPSANDVGRDILAVRAEPAPGCFAAAFTVHFKSGFDPSDRFRRQVEAERLGQAIERFREERPQDAVFALGDFNERLDGPDLGASFETLPSNLPQSYRLGTDIELPLRYHPFVPLDSLGFELADATQEDSPIRETWQDISRIDYVLFLGAALVDDEVYNACRDDGVDDDPPGDWLPKAGEPLACYTSVVASDHLPVVADLTL